MRKRSRLRVQRPKKGRRVIFYLIGFLTLATVGYQLDHRYEITPYLKDFLLFVKSSFSLKESRRGTFFDRNLKQLAVTLERVSVYVRTREVDSIPETAKRLAQVFAINKQQLADQLESGVLRLWIAKDISREQEKTVRELELPGLYFQKEKKRYYPNKFGASHLIGYVENGIGLSGVEFYYDRLLAGEELKKDDSESLRESPDLVLTLDMKIQGILDTLVGDIAETEKADRVAAYLLESETGAIVAGANLPGIDPNNFSSYSKEQLENVFFTNFCLPEKFKLFLRDALLLHSDRTVAVNGRGWSTVSGGADLGTQLRLWEWLSLEEPERTDFFSPPEKAKRDILLQKPASPTENSFGIIPETLSPMNLLKGLAVLLGDGRTLHPFVVKKILDRQSVGDESLSGVVENREKVSSWTPWQKGLVQSLFHSQAKKGPANSYLLRDAVVVRSGEGDSQRFSVNDLLFTTIPAGEHDLNLLVVVQRPPSFVENGDRDKIQSLTGLVEKKIERISVLQQVAKIVADVVEPETREKTNYITKIKSIFREPDPPKKETSQRPALHNMPDLRGLSLRKSLRLLQGARLDLKIRGTGRVVDQRPKPGSSLKGVTECVLILEKQEPVVPAKLNKEQHDGK